VVLPPERGNKQHLRINTAGDRRHGGFFFFFSALTVTVPISLDLKCTSRLLHGSMAPWAPPSAPGQINRPAIDRLLIGTSWGAILAITDESEQRKAMPRLAVAPGSSAPKICRAVIERRVWLGSSRATGPRYYCPPLAVGHREKQALLFEHRTACGGCSSFSLGTADDGRARLISPTAQAHPLQGDKQSNQSNRQRRPLSSAAEKRGKKMERGFPC